MKTEMHSHSTGASVCSDVTDEQFVNDFAKEGFQAFVLTNHINGAFSTYPANTYKEKIDYYLSRYDEIKSIAQSKGIKLFLGAEIVALTDDGVHQEFILLGFDREFLYNNNLVNRYNQKELFVLANQHGFFMYQTHPFRRGEKTGNPLYMHGAEAGNGHYHHDNFNEKAIEFCEKHNLKKVVGTDYHHHLQPIVGWTEIPDYIENEQQLAKYLLENQTSYEFDQEKCLQAREEYKEYERRKG